MVLLFFLSVPFYLKDGQEGLMFVAIDKRYEMRAKSITDIVPVIVEPSNISNLFLYKKKKVPDISSLLMKHSVTYSYNVPVQYTPSSILSECTP